MKPIKDEQVLNTPIVRNRLAYIDGLRGFAVLLVIVRHFYMDSFGPGMPRWADICGLGYLGVHLFLLLSGFCLAYAFVGPKQKPLILREFFIRRATRILPAYYAALLLFTVLAMPFTMRDLLWQTLTHVTMTHNVFPATVLAINGAFWSLGLECQLYLLFPVLILLIRRKGMLPVMAAVLLMQIVFRSIVAHYYGTEWNETMRVAWSLPGRMGDFTLGILAAMLVLDPKLYTIALKLKANAPMLTFASFALGMLAKHRIGVSAWQTDLAFDCAFGSLLIWSSEGRTPDGRASIASRLMSWRPLCRLGEKSYSVYLIHVLPLRLVVNALRSHNVSARHSLEFWMIPTIGLAILFGYAFYWLVEGRYMRFFSQRAGEHRARVAAMVPVPPALILAVKSDKA